MEIPKPILPTVDRRTFLKAAAASMAAPFLGEKVSAIPVRRCEGTPTQGVTLQYTLRGNLTAEETQTVRNAERQILDFFQHIQNLRNQGRQGLIQIDKNRIETFNSAMRELSELIPGQITINLNNQNLLAETKLWADNENPVGIQFTNCRFQSPNGRVSFTGSDLSHAAFTNCSLQNAVLTNVTATNEASFIDSNLTGADLRSSNFSTAVFGNSNLTDVVCNDRTSFENAELQGATLRTNTLGLSILTNAAYGEWARNITTTFSPGFNPGEHGMISRRFER